MTHYIRILPEYFKAVEHGKKRFELRKNDRDYKVGDNIALQEWDGKRYTGREIYIVIQYVLKDCPEYGLKKGYCIFGW